VFREWKRGANGVEVAQVAFLGSVRKHACKGQKHSGVGRVVASLVVILKLRRVSGDVVDDEIGHDGGSRREGLDVVPRAETGIDLRVVDRIESGVGSVDRMKEGEQVNAAERFFQRTLEERRQVAKPTTREPIHVGDELRLVDHGYGSVAATSGMAPWTPATMAPARFAKTAIRSAAHFDARPWTNAAAKASPAPTGSATCTGTPGELT
jgi:hypothetical protein